MGATQRDKSESCWMPCLQELKDFQRDGHSLEDLWKVAKGDIKYHDFVQRSIPREGQQQQQQQQKVPEELVCPAEWHGCSLKFGAV